MYSYFFHGLSVLLYYWFIAGKNLEENLTIANINRLQSRYNYLFHTDIISVILFKNV